MVDFLQELNILFQYLLVFFFVVLGCVLEVVSEDLLAILQHFPPLDVLPMCISVALHVRFLFLNPLLVETDDTSLEGFEVVVAAVEDLEAVISELFHFSFLLLELFAQLLQLGRETLLTHAEVFNDEGQVLIDSLEVEDFRTHLVDLFVQGLNL